MAPTCVPIERARSPFHCRARDGTPATLPTAQPRSRWSGGVRSGEPNPAPTHWQHWQHYARRRNKRSGRGRRHWTTDDLSRATWTARAETLPQQPVWLAFFCPGSSQGRYNEPVHLDRPAP